MGFRIISKKEKIPAFDPHSIKVKYIKFHPSSTGYKEEQITETLISQILNQMHKRIDVILFLDLYGEDYCLEVNGNGEWIALDYYTGEENFSSYNVDFADTNELSPLVNDSMCYVEKRFAIKDINAAVKAVEYFIRTGDLYPGIDWMHKF